MSYDIFISYKRKTADLANNLYFRLHTRGFRVFYDIEEMSTGSFPPQIEEYIRNATDVFVLLEPGSLNACYNGTHKEDWFCKEVAIALRLNKNVIPMMINGFTMPKAEELPNELKDLPSKHGPEFSLSYFESYLDKLIEKGHIHSSPISNQKNSTFKFISKDSTLVFNGNKLIARITEGTNEPFYYIVENSGEYKFKCVNEKTKQIKYIEKYIGINEEKTINIDWEYVPNTIKQSNLPIDIEGYQFNMIYVKGGEFEMGATGLLKKDSFINETLHENVEVNDFYMCEVPVTQKLWLKVMGYNNSKHQNENPQNFFSEDMNSYDGYSHEKSSYKFNDELPVENVTFAEVKKFIERLSKITKYKFSLPTEEEWEYAAKEGEKGIGHIFSGGNNLDSYGWYNDNSDRYPQPVARKDANALGLFDMSGNVWEWTQSKYKTNKAPRSKKTNENKYIIRGGCYESDTSDCRVSRRLVKDPNNADSKTGFRLVLHL